MDTDKQTLFMAVVKYECLALLLETKMSGLGPKQDVATKNQSNNAQHADIRPVFPKGAHIRRPSRLFSSSITAEYIIISV